MHAIAISDDGTTALTAGFDYSIIHWDLATEKARALMFGHDAAVSDGSGRQNRCAPCTGTTAMCLLLPCPLTGS